MDDFAAPPQGKRAWHSFALGSDQFVWLVANLCKLNGVAITESQLLKEFPPPHNREQLLEAMRTCGLHAGLTTIRGEELEASLLPVVAFPREILGSEGSPDYRGAGLIVGITGERFLYVEAGSEAPRFRQKRHFREFFEPTVILGTRMGVREPAGIGYSDALALPR
jgi:hypothetical protein